MNSMEFDVSEKKQVHKNRGWWLSSKFGDITPPLNSIEWNGRTIRKFFQALDHLRGVGTVCDLARQNWDPPFFYWNLTKPTGPVTYTWCFPFFLPWIRGIFKASQGILLSQAEEPCESWSDLIWRYSSKYWTNKNILRKTLSHNIESMSCRDGWMGTSKLRKFKHLRLL